jgi:hypothetical protein
MRNYEERAKDFIKEIFPYISDFTDLYSVYEDVNTFNYDRNRKVKVSHGCARIALITSDYVIKFDFDSEEVKFIGGCDNEMELYAKAEAEGFAYLFAKITEFSYNGKYFYIMPRIRGINENKNWAHFANYFMTPEETAWCNRHHLTDLHCNNYGFRNGKICIVDYGCRDGCSSES